MPTIKRLPKGVHSSLRSSVILSDLPRVIEELIYNSIDANASKVYLYIWRREKQYIISSLSFITINIHVLFISDWHCSKHQSLLRKSGRQWYALIFSVKKHLYMIIFFLKNHCHTLYKLQVVVLHAMNWFCWEKNIVSQKLLLFIWLSFSVFPHFMGLFAC